MNSNITLPVILQLVGVIVIIAEIILPSGGILSVLAVGIFGYSLYFVFQDVSVSAGFGFVVADVINPHSGDHGAEASRHISGDPS